jgi:hypothetical protein
VTIQAKALQKLRLSANLFCAQVRPVQAQKRETAGNYRHPVGLITRFVYVLQVASKLVDAVGYAISMVQRGK